MIEALDPGEVAPVRLDGPGRDRGETRLEPVGSARDIQELRGEAVEGRTHVPDREDVGLGEIDPLAARDVDQPRRDMERVVGPDEVPDHQ